MNQSEIEREKARIAGILKRFSEPYVPLTGQGVSTEHRVAHALEYIAAQLGRLNEKGDFPSNR